MPEAFLLVIHAGAIFLGFTALGLGPSVGLVREDCARFAMAPILGFAIAACLLTTAAAVMPVGTAAWFVLLPATAASLGGAAVLVRRRPTRGAHDLAVPGAAVVIALTIALLPPLMRGTEGPFSLGVYDAWGYAATTAWLKDHKATDHRAPDSAEDIDLTLAWGQVVTGTSTRIGVDAVDAAAASLLGASTAAVLSALLAVLFALASLSIWIVARAIGASRGAAAFAALFGLTPAILSLVEDTALGNLAGIVITPVALLFIVRSARHSLIADALVAGILVGGLIAVFPEFLAPLLVVTVVAMIALTFDRARIGDLRTWLVSACRNLALCGIAAVAVAPYAVYRAFSYLRFVANGGAWDLGLPTRGIDVQNVGAWAFGVLGLYELPSFSLLSPSRLAFALYFPALLTVIVVAGILARPLWGVVFVLVPVSVAVGVGHYLYEHHQNGRCEYCQWKALTGMTPFLAIGLALGLDRIASSHRSKGSQLPWLLAALAVGLVALVAVGRSDARLIDQTHDRGVFFPSQLRDAGADLSRLPHTSGVLIEGTSAMPASPFTLPAAYYALQGHGSRVLFDAVSPSPAYLGVADNPDPYYGPHYGYVLTPFTGLRTGRKVLGNYGPFVLQRRSPVDVVISVPYLAIGPDAPKVPWLSAPFRLRISSPKPQAIALSLSLAQSTNGPSTLLFSEGTTRLPGWAAKSATRICVNVPLRRGTIDVNVTPVVDPLAPSLAPGQLSDTLALTAVTTRAGRCKERRRAQPPLVFGDGWYPSERDTGGHFFRWMGSIATMRLGIAGMHRPPVIIEGRATSLARPRNVEVRLGRVRIATIRTRASGASPFSFVVPAGQGAASLTLLPHPSAQPAAVVNPADPRTLSVIVRDVRLLPVKS